MSQRKNLQVEVVELKGSAYDIGVRQGAALKSHPKWRQQTESQTNEDTIEARMQIERISSNLLKETEGLAAGMKININAAIQLFGGYNIQMPSMGCTTLATDSFYVRNYDFNDELYDARLVLIKPDNGYASIGFSQQITGRLDGMNEKGLIIGLHLVNEKISQEGFLATAVCRLVLEQCAVTDEAVSLIKQIPHQYCVNFSIMDKEGNNAIVEASPEKQIVRKNAQLICTNHFETEQLNGKNRAVINGSLNRKKYLSALEKEKLTSDSVYPIFNREHSPLFFKHYKEYFGTLHTVVYCPKDLSVMIGVGGDCAPYELFFAEWLKGKGKLPVMLEGEIIS
ncbi:C45 family autoproteolytic acyltransferase/hydolase [Oceanobacillus neutriphilus]|uniref:Choloylglycine hydrolase n=1 Tax=Oceanobacillus neutriphilus TaxID=531815 RepID=A0ABQ2P2M0_9BACI|nr:C45 family peptidase [Oceanobacillus neutriphilus]GGP16361.1 choloylglycine hydrolase [Oceanobacillus neutriphilus]